MTETPREPRCETLWYVSGLAVTSPQDYGIAGWCGLARAVRSASLGDTETEGARTMSEPLPACDYCTEHGYDHRVPGSKPMSAWVSTSMLDGDGQPMAIIVAYAGGHHVGEGEAEYVRRALRAAGGYERGVADERARLAPLLAGLHKAVADDSTELVDANIIRLLLDRADRSAPPVSASPGVSP